MYNVKDVNGYNYLINENYIVCIMPIIEVLQNGEIIKNTYEIKMVNTPQGKYSYCIIIDETQYNELKKIIINEKGA